MPAATMTVLTPHIELSRAPFEILRSGAYQRAGNAVPDGKLELVGARWAIHSRGRS
jgi:hypothetical protein